MNLNEIQDLIKFVAKSGVDEVEIERKDFKLVIRANTNKVGTQLIQSPVQAVLPTTHVVQPVSQPVVQPVSKPADTATGDDSKYVTIKSPMIGTFYRQAGPDKPSFVNIGDVVKKGDVICIIEAMKLFNEIEAEVSGKIVKVLVDDSKPVEYDQPLFLVEPA
ncbi:MAG: acetyl-CoA carboxylase biotin carboxyl carrier protein [Flavobacteriales bacterium]